MSEYIKLEEKDKKRIQKLLQEVRAKQRNRLIDWNKIYVHGVKEMTEKTVGKLRSRSRTLWFSGTLFTSGVALIIAFLSSPAFNLFVETNVPNALLGVVVAAIGAVVAWLREVTTEPIAK